MTPTSSYNNSQRIVQPGWRDRRPFPQSLASRSRVLLELFLPKALKEEVEVGVVAGVVGRRVGKEVGRPGLGCQTMALLAAFPQT